MIYYFTIQFIILKILLNTSNIDVFALTFTDIYDDTCDINIDNLEKFSNVFTDKIKYYK